MKSLKNITHYPLLVLASIALTSCQSQPQAISLISWGKLQQQPVSLYTLTNHEGMQVKLTTIGASITELWVKDRQGQFEDVVLGYDSAQGYSHNAPNFGATIGRFANRIGHAEFTIDGIRYPLTKNGGGNSLHGSGEFKSAIWQGAIIETKLGPGVQFSYLSKDGSHGFPGNLAATVTYVLTDDNALHLFYRATTDKATHVNLTNHSYFNLNGGKHPIYDQLLWLKAKQYTVNDDSVTPTGEIADLAGKPWDLSQPTRMGDKMAQIPLNGYHHNYVLDKPKGKLSEVAELIDPNSGRKMTLATTQPGIVLYAANVLEPGIKGKYGRVYGPHSAICIEPQHYPDAPNHANFPSTLLRPNEVYQQRIVYRFSVVAKP